MTDPLQITFLRNGEINKLKWDECIALANNGLIYAQTFYLDSLAKGWSGLAGKDYSWVLPLTKRRKFGIKYLYQRPFTQQLGVFAKPGVIIPYQQILNYLQQYKFWEMNWNYATPATIQIPGLQITQAINFILDLNTDYESIAARYHTDLSKNLKKSKRFKLNCRSSNDFVKQVSLYKVYYEKRTPHVKKSHYKNFETMCASAAENQCLICREVVDENEVLLSTALLLTDGRRLYNLMNTATEAGRQKSANHFLLDAVIHEFSGKPLIFDFEGSDLPGVKNFYENFGAVNQPYFKLKYNNLPWPLNVLKR